MNQSHRKIVVITSSILAVAVIVVAMLALWLYTGSASAAKLGVLKATGLPVGKVGDTTVSAKDMATYEALASVLKKPADILLTDAAQLQNVASGKVEASNSEIEQAETSLQRDNTYMRTVEAVGADMARGTVVKSYVLNYKLQIWYAARAATLEPILAQRLQTAQEQLNQGVDFANVARQYSEDEATLYFAGDAGYVNLEDAIPEYRDAVTLLEKNKRAVVYTRYGIHLVEVLGEISQDGKRLVNLREIVLRPKNYDAWLAKEIAAVPVVWYVK